MRLLNTRILRLSEFVGDSIPEYVALSHTWVTDQEISLQDLQKILAHPVQEATPHPFTLRSGYQKIVGCCAQALHDEFEWAWIDTCCIDKTSSSELSEAINSMFQWYSDCRICYTFLSDVSDDDVLNNADSEFRASRWFKRGWTLQELLAPPELRFFSKLWNGLGNRADLHDLVSQVTNIPDIYFVGNSATQPDATSLQNRGTHKFFEASVAQRMSWASRRSTTRKEDLAYCLLGIFHVNIPLLYGEGDKAFRRLQEEIIRQTNDQTIFTWGYGLFQSPEAAPMDVDNTEPYPYLATSPLGFQCCHDVVKDHSWKNRRAKGFEVTKRGLHIDIFLSLIHPTLWPDGIEAWAVLDCRPNRDLFNRIAIPLSGPWRHGNEIFVMRKHGSPRLWPKHLTRHTAFKTVYIIETGPELVEFQRISASAMPGGSVVIPVMPFLAVEHLTADSTLSITTPSGFDHLNLQEADSFAPTLASGRAYFRFRPDNIVSNHTPSVYPDSIVMISFQVSPEDDIDASSNTLSNQPHRLRKRRYKTKGIWWPYQRPCLRSPESPHQTVVTGIVYCFITQAPAVSGELLRSLEYLKTLPWADSIPLGTKDEFRVRLREEVVMGYKKCVLSLTIVKDTQISAIRRLVMDWLFIHNQMISMAELFRLGILAFLGFSSAMLSSKCLENNNFFAGSLWMIIGIAFMTCCISGRRSDHELPQWLLITWFAFCIINAFFITVLRTLVWGSITVAFSIGLIFFGKAFLSPHNRYVYIL